jgi:hypothetical protein
MRAFLILPLVALLVSAGLLISAEQAVAAGGCGVAPTPPAAPLGCGAMQPTCVCDAQGHCHWEYICLRQ